MKPNLREEKRLWKRGIKRVVCLDEAGRGPLAGPVIAAAVMINSRKFVPKFVQIRELRDSKKLSPKKREEFYKIITKNPWIEWGIGRVSERVIDKINILEATKLAMKRAIKNLFKKSCFQKRTIMRIKKQVVFLILDGNFKIDSLIPQKSIIKGDEKVLSCAIASIMAKVTRDRIMEKYAKKFPKYGFDKHKGYPTKYHIKMLKKYGPCKIHRKTFGPVRKIQKRLQN